MALDKLVEDLSEERKKAMNYLRVMKFPCEWPSGKNQVGFTMFSDAL